MTGRESAIDQAALLATLNGALRAQPSAEFDAGVRRKIARHRRQRAWQWAAVAAGVALFASASNLWPRVHDAPAPQASVAAVEYAASSAPPAAHTPVRAPVRPDVARPGTIVRTRDVASAATSTPEVLVPADQRIALKRVLAAIREGRGVGAASPSAETPIDVLPEIEPIKIAPLDPDPLTGRGQGAGNQAGRK